MHIMCMNESMLNKNKLYICVGNNFQSYKFIIKKTKARSDLNPWPAVHLSDDTADGLVRKIILQK